ncbi:MAG: glycosyltransferase [Clostridiaceae bacterium]
MKVLITTDSYSPVINGVVTSVLNLQKELIILGHDVKILTLSENRKFSRKANVTYISSIGLGKIYPGARVAISMKNKYSRELCEWRPDIIHSQCEFSTFVIAHQLAKELGVPIIHTYHTVYEDYIHYYSPSKKIGKKAAAIFTAKVLKDTACIIAPTEKVRSLLLKYGLNQPIKVVPTGLDLTRFVSREQNDSNRILREKLGISINKNILVFVGRLAKEKNWKKSYNFYQKLKMII